jgi:hypothetical protein
MSYSSTFTATGARHSLHVEFIGGAYTMEIAIQDDLGKRIQCVRIPLNDFDFADLNMFSSYIHANISSMDPQDIADLSDALFAEDDEYDDEEDGEEV